ncbi:hypothetical protein ACGF5C_34465 [Micromonospora sp. NPDC047620]|uniref:effector-associated constant component EACC1 n=1 Tax=Micromonospora sp. NPDC047620 TaxID=3364251 RepID=UPI0037183724
MQFDISVASAQPEEDLVSLNRWLGNERDLVGCVTLVGSDPGEEELGGAWDTLAVAVGSGGLFTVVASSLQAWLGNRPRTKVTIKCGKNTVELDSGRADEVPELLKILMQDELGPQS